jgi:hypothetical protein
MELNLWNYKIIEKIIIIQSTIWLKFSQFPPFWPIGITLAVARLTYYNLIAKPHSHVFEIVC